MKKDKENSEIDFLFLCDEHSYALSGKINAIGIFNIFKVWDFPANRDASVVVYINNILKDKKLIINWISPSEKKIKLGVASLKSSKFAKGLTQTAHHFIIPISEEGVHYIEGTIDNSKRRVPIIVKSEKWREFTKEEIEKILKDPFSVKSARIDVTCGKCKRVHTFEVHIDPSKKNTPGTIPFPKSGKFKCKTKTCQNIIHTRDLEGYARSMLGKSPIKKG